MGRHEQREQIFKLVFQTEFNTPEEMPEQVKLYFEDEERTFTETDREQMKNRFQQVQEKLGEIDEMISQKTTGWGLDRMGKVELALLRLAVYEIVFDEDIPDGVAINEAVELAKKYGQENSGAFVNAVLAKFVKQGD